VAGCCQRLTADVPVHDRLRVAFAVLANLCLMAKVRVADPVALFADRSVQQRPSCVPQVPVQATGDTPSADPSITSGPARVAAVRQTSLRATGALPPEKLDGRPDAHSNRSWASTRDGFMTNTRRLGRGWSKPVIVTRSRTDCPRKDRVDAAQTAEQMMDLASLATNDRHLAPGARVCAVRNVLGLFRVVVPAGTTGVVEEVREFGSITVRWDSGRQLAVSDSLLGFVE
jgi:hypothetical protein